MKQALLCAISCVFVLCCQKEKGTSIHGKINGKTIDYVVLSSDLYSDEQDTVQVIDGKFNFSVDPNYIGYKYLSFGKNTKELFLAPGYCLELLINANDTSRYSLKLEGEGKIQNNISDSISKLVQPDVNSIYSCTPNKGLPLLDSCFTFYEQRLKILFENKSLDSSFIQYQTANLKYAYLSIKTQLGIQHGITNPDYYSFLNETDLEQEALMGFPNYKGFLDTYINAKASISNSNEISDEQYLDVILQIIQKIKNSNIREYLLYNKINIFVSGDLINNKQKYITYGNSRITNTSYLSKLRVLSENLRLIEKGMRAPSFTLKCFDGEDVSLSDYAGKLIYIDFWATWCHPCIKEFPAFLKLQESYKNKKIVFISISLDENRTNWLNFSKEHPFIGVNLWAEKGIKSELAKSYLINSIPQFILIDTKGNYITHNAPKPSSEEIHNLLDSVLLIK